MNSGVTQQKVRHLLEELRSWDPGEVRCTLQDLSERFGLEPFVVDQIARSDGIELTPRCPSSDEIIPDPEASTIDLDPVAVQEALETPEEDPSYLDKDTGVWRKKPTGEWEIVGGEESES